MPYYYNTLFQKIPDEVFFSMPFYGSISGKNKTVTSEQLLSYLFFYLRPLIYLTNGRKEPFFRLIEDNLRQIHTLFQTVFKTFLKDKEKIINALQLLYPNAKLEATNNLIKFIKRNAFGFRNFENFKKRVFI